MPDLNLYQRMARAMEIFNSYPVDRYAGISAEHDEIYAGPAPSTVTAEHLAELEQLGWLPDGDHGFRYFT